MNSLNIGKYTVFFGDDRLYFEHNTAGENNSICLYLEDGRIYDYDGAYCIPKRVGKWLKEQGYNVLLDDDGMWDINWLEG